MSLSNVFGLLFGVSVKVGSTVLTEVSALVLLAVLASVVLGILPLELVMWLGLGVVNVTFGVGFADVFG